MYVWHTLNPQLAEYNAVAGCYAHGTACLERADGTVTVVGHYTGGGRERAEKELRSIAAAAPGMVGADRRIKRSVFESWIVR
jgi:hypothetical protein